MARNIQKRNNKVQMLCSMGVDGQVLIPTLLPELRSVVPAKAGTFLWTNQRYEFINLYDETPYSAAFANKYLVHYLDNLDSEVRPSLKNWLRDDGGVVNTKAFNYPGFYQSTYYAEIYQPLGYHHSVMMGLKDGAHPHGILFLHREEHEPDFSKKEIDKLWGLQADISSSLSRQEFKQTEFTSGASQGLLLCDAQGNVKNLCALGQRHIYMVAHPQISKHAVMRQSENLVIPMGLQKLMHQVAQDPNIDSREKALIWEDDNGWGQFIFRGYWLHRTNPFCESMIAISSEHLEPVSLKIFRNADQLGLTAKEIEICVDVIMGNSYAEIAKKRFITQNTVITHIKNIYDKLGVENRSTLIRRLIKDTN